MENISIVDKNVWYVRVEYRITMVDGDIKTGRDVFPCMYGVDRMIVILCGLLGLRYDKVSSYRVVIEL